MSYGTSVNSNKIEYLLAKFRTKQYRSDEINDHLIEEIVTDSINLWERDYTCMKLDNTKGKWCSTYPSTIIIPLSDRNLERELSSASESDPITNYVTEKAINARCWYRFPVPTIICKGKFICRSGSISCLMDVYGKNIWKNLDYDLPLETVKHVASFGVASFADLMKWWSSDNPAEDLGKELGSKHASIQDEARFKDIALLKKLRVSCIIDLMVENKKLKHGILRVCSSEKTDKMERYSAFNILSVPYPGCEFFEKFTKNNYNSKGLYYEWENPEHDAELTIPEYLEEQIGIPTDWGSYKTWDLRTLTKNYLKLILRCITSENVKEKGFLVHCISGWDRTPLFISLIRLSLWADCLIHLSLNPKEMLYFTLAYDWYLFGHNLPNRLKKNENVLHFCFEFLEELGCESFFDVADNRSSVINVEVSKTTASISSDKENIVKLKDLETEPLSNLSKKMEKQHIKRHSMGSPVRSPLQEKNISLQKTSPSGKRASDEKERINEELKKPAAGKRIRKSLTDSLDLTLEERLKEAATDIEIVKEAEVHGPKFYSKPISVPGERSASSSFSEFEEIDNPELVEHSTSFEDEKSFCKVDKIDDLGMSRLQYRKHRLLKVRDIFFAVYHRTNQY